MGTYPIPSNEKERGEAVEAINLLYTPQEERFDRITRLAKHIFSIAHRDYFVDTQ